MSQYLNLSNSVYDNIKQQIIEFNLKPGDKISEQIISDQFQISKTPAREALLKLSEDMLVEAVPYKGTFISLISMQNIEDMVFMRNTIEKQVIVEFSKIATQENWQQLENILKAQAQAIEVYDVHEFFKLDDLYHRYFYETTKRNNVYQIIKDLSASYLRVRYLTLNLDRLQELYSEHTCILNTLKDNHLEDAILAFEKHITRIHIEKTLLLEKYPAYFQ